MQTLKALAYPLSWNFPDLVVFFSYEVRNNVNYASSNCTHATILHILLPVTMVIIVMTDSSTTPFLSGKLNSLRRVHNENRKKQCHHDT